MDWREILVAGVLIAFFVTLGIVVGTAMKHANKS